MLMALLKILILTHTAFYNIPLYIYISSLLSIHINNRLLRSSSAPIIEIPVNSPTSSFQYITLTLDLYAINFTTIFVMRTIRPYLNGRYLRELTTQHITNLAYHTNTQVLTTQHITNLAYRTKTLHYITALTYSIINIILNIIII